MLQIGSSLKFWLAKLDPIVNDDETGIDTSQIIAFAFE